MKTYLKFIDWLRDYITHYVDIFKFLQNRKIELLREELVAESARRFYSAKTRVQNFIDLKIVFFKTLQNILSKSFYLMHVNTKRQLFIDLNVNKKFDIEIMLYYVKKIYFKNFKLDQFSSRHVIESIFFFNRLVIETESRYWFIELKIVDIVWIFKKIKHIVKVFTVSIVIYTNHDFALNIINQITLSITFIDKLNLRLIRVFDYIQRFNLNIRHKFDKQHIVSDAFSRLTNANISTSPRRNSDDDELNALFIISLIEMN